MASYKIVNLPGDGIGKLETSLRSLVARRDSPLLFLASHFPGPEVTAEAVRVLECLTEYSDLKFTVESHDFGGIAIDNHANPLPPSTLAACQTADAILLGKRNSSPP